MKNEKWVEGEITKTDGEPNPHSFWIKDKEGIQYFAHLGDLENNSSKLLYNKDAKTEFLKKGDSVKFQVWEDKDNTKKAFHVTKSR